MKVWLPDPLHRLSEDLDLEDGQDIRDLREGTQERHELVRRGKIH